MALACLFVALFWRLLAMGCGGGEESGLSIRRTQRDSAASRPDVSRTAVQTSPRVVVLGDSLTAGLGLPREQAYPALLQRKLKDAGHDLEVVNAGVSGDTSADGLRRAAGRSKATCGC